MPRRLEENIRRSVENKRCPVEGIRLDDGEGRKQEGGGEEGGKAAEGWERTQEETEGDGKGGDPSETAQGSRGYRTAHQLPCGSSADLSSSSTCRMVSSGEATLCPTVRGCM